MSTSIGSSASASGSDGSSDTTTSSASSEEGGSSSSSGMASDTATDDGPGTDDGSPPVGLEDVGTLVILGDSIGDGGGQAPYYYHLLRDSLDGKFGGVEYHNNAHGGSETDELVSQVGALPDTLPGPVVVCLTSGGNDMKDAILDVVTGQDQEEKQTMIDNIDAALGDLLEPDRFGPGVEVYVFEGNIYDASDGQGDYGENGCAFGQGYPTLPVDPYFDAWNAAISGAVDEHGQSNVDMHSYFYGHGYHAGDNWYAPDCTHPNATGHDQLHRLFYFHITGDEL